jgi:hypothetical protein
MDEILLKPMRSEVLYQGRFTSLAFGLLAPPISLYQNLLKHLSQYGASLQNLSAKLDVATLADVSLSCFLTELSTIIQMHLDRFEVNFYKFHEVGFEIANQILHGTWTAVHEADASISVVEHTVAITIHAQIDGAAYDSLMGRYIRQPSTFSENHRAGVVFYVPGDPSTGERPSTIVLDRLLGQEQGLFMKVTAAYDATQVSIDELARTTDESLSRFTAQLGLTLQREIN